MSAILDLLMENKELTLEKDRMQNSYNVAIEFTLSLNADDGHIFLELWNEGCWPEIADEFPEFDLTSAPTGFEE